MNDSAPSWNPLRCSGTSLPPELLVLAKLLMLLSWRFRLWQSFPRPLNAFVAAFELVPGSLWLLGIKGAFVVASAALLFNRRVRSASLVLGLCILFAVLSSRTFFQNNRTFVGCALFCVGLTPDNGSRWLIRSQVALVYFCAGLNKLCEADWRSGRFMAVWGSRFIIVPAYLALQALLPAGLLPLLMSWATIATELSISVSLAVRRLNGFGVWAGLMLHTGLFFLTNRTFGLFYYAAATSYLAFGEWPRAVVVEYSGPWAEALERWITRLDLEGRFTWQSAREPAPGRVELTLRAGGKAWTQLEALRALLSFNPLTYFVVFALITIPEPGGLHFRRWLALAFWLLASPPLTFIAQRLFGRAAKPEQVLAS